VRRTYLVIGTLGFLLLAFRLWNGGVRPDAQRADVPVRRRVCEAGAGDSRAEGMASSHAPARPVQRRGTVDGFVSRVARMSMITAARATYIERTLRGLAMRGPAGARAIADVLRRGDDVHFAMMIGGELVGHRTLREALIDTLGRIGGHAAAAVALEQIRRTTEPMETVMLARILEREEPGAHGDEVIQAASEALRAAEQGPVRASPDVGPLFGLLASYGGGRAVAELERTASRWEPYALIALADVPGGGGIPSVAALARRADAPLADVDLPFRILAQAAGDYDDAGDALLELARTGGIPDGTWAAIGESLAGRQLRLSSRMFDGTPLGSEGSAPVWKTYYVEWQNARYEEDVVSADWSDERVDRQLAFIADLRAAASTSAAEQALQHARDSLEARLLAAVD
jgi:hypothetical protein